MSLNAVADSYCWPEEQMIGTQAIAYIEGIDATIYGWNNSDVQMVLTQKPTENDRSCKVMAFEKYNGVGKSLACGDLRCIKGDCGGGAEVTSLPVEDFKNPFVKTSLKNGEKVWLKFDGQLFLKPIMYIGKLGDLSENGKLFDRPRGKKIDFDGSVRVLDFVTVGEEIWVRADVAPVQDGEPPIKIGSSLGQAYFLYKNSKKEIVNVVSDIWCD